jgi:hypothetical protein
LVVFAGSAQAHVCTQSVEVKVGKQFQVNIGVAAEDKAVTGVKIGVPPGFELKDDFGFLGWVGERRGDVVEFTGGTIEPYQCAYFTLQGVIGKKGTYVAEIETVAADGTRKTYTSRNPYSPVPAMMLYAGVSMPSPEDFAEGGGGSDSGGVLRALAVAVILGAGAVVVAIRLNGRRSG